MLFVVAHYLGPSELGRFAILYFGAGLLAQLLTIAVKPGTIRRTFARGDDEDEDEDDDEDVSDSPKRSLGTGLSWRWLLAVVGGAPRSAARADRRRASWASADGDLIIWAALLGGATSSSGWSRS